MTPELQAQCYGFLKWFVPALAAAWFAGIGVVAYLERNDPER